MRGRVLGEGEYWRAYGLGEHIVHPASCRDVNWSRPVNKGEGGFILTRLKAIITECRQHVCSSI